LVVVVVVLFGREGGGELRGGGEEGARVDAGEGQVLLRHDIASTRRTFSRIMCIVCDAILASGERVRARAAREERGREGRSAGRSVSSLSHETRAKPLPARAA
jgi:hypothetical protein